MLFPGSP